MSNEGIFVGLHNAVMIGINALATPHITQYASAVSTLAAGSITLYLLWRSYQTSAGKLQVPLAEIAWGLTRMVMILAFTLNVSNYLNIIVGSIDDLEDGFGGGGAGNIWVVLDTLWASAQALGEKIYSMDDSTYVKLNGGMGKCW